MLLCWKSRWSSPAKRGEDKTKGFCQPRWEKETRHYYKLDAILSTPVRESVPEPESWMFGCIQRVRAFGIYDQSDRSEYAIALAIAMLRWCKFKRLGQGHGDKGAEWWRWRSLRS